MNAFTKLMTRTLGIQSPRCCREPKRTAIVSPPVWRSLVLNCAAEILALTLVLFLFFSLQAPWTRWGKFEGSTMEVETPTLSSRGLPLAPSRVLPTQDRVTGPRDPRGIPWACRAALPEVWAGCSTGNRSDERVLGCFYFLNCWCREQFREQGVIIKSIYIAIQKFVMKIHIYIFCNIFLK